MSNVDSLFDEAAAALQFPSYFGENWAAFDECLSDIDWLPTDQGLVIVVLDSDLVLAQSPRDLPALIRAFVHAGESYSQPINAGEWWDRPAVPYRVVLQASPAAAAGVRDRWTEAGALIAKDPATGA